MATPATPDAWRRHDGTPGAPGTVYLVAPDPAIGAVRSAESNRTAAGFAPMDRPYQTLVFEVGALALVTGWFGVAAVLAAPHASPLPWSDGLSLTQKGLCLGAAMTMALLAAGVTMLMRPRRASFVGEVGLQARVERPWGGRTELVTFADCTELRVMQTRHLLNGAYYRTTFRYAFVDQQGTPRFQIEGHFDERKPKQPPDQYRFAIAAQAGWNAWKQRRSTVTR